MIGRNCCVQQNSTIYVSITATLILMLVFSLKIKPFSWNFKPNSYAAWIFKKKPIKLVFCFAAIFPVRNFRGECD